MNSATESRLIDDYELERCVSWINDNSFERVCLQFPDDLLADSVDVALYIDQRVPFKTFILADTSYFSCCVDDLGRQHIDGDAVVHFGSSCLSPFTACPVLYVLPKYDVDLAQLLRELSIQLVKGRTLVLLEVGYAHLIERLEEELRPYEVAVSRLAACGEKAGTVCGPWCTGTGLHSTTRLGHSFCTTDDLQRVVFIGTGKSADNFLLSMKVPEFYTYDKTDGLQLRSKMRLFKSMSFLVERIKNAAVFGLLMGTLSLERYLDVVDHIKRLLKTRRRKSFIISVGRPTIAKLSNFPEIDVFVIISCHEGCYIDNKDVMAPIVTLMEVELAFNDSRSWSDPLSTDFSFLLEGGDGHVQAPLTQVEEGADIELTTGFTTSTKCTDNSMEVAVKPDMHLTTSSFSTAPRTWDGLELVLDSAGHSTVIDGRRGTAQSYSSESLQQST